MNIKYVSEGSAAFARGMERKFQQLPPETGVLFISVLPRKTLDGISTEFDLTLGASRIMGIEYSTLDILINVVLSEELEAGGITIYRHVAMGVCGSL